MTMIGVSGWFSSSTGSLGLSWQNPENRSNSRSSSNSCIVVECAVG